jgi:hypothetical protein
MSFLSPNGAKKSFSNLVLSDFLSKLRDLIYRDSSDEGISLDALVYCFLY